MCLCGQCFICLGCNRNLVEIGTPEGFQDPPEKLQCMACGKITKGVYIVEEQRCCCCLIPCCACGHSDPVLGCKNCHVTFGGMSPARCSNCGVSSVMKSEYCANCGARKSGGSSAQQAGGSDNSERPDDTRRDGDRGKKTIGSMQRDDGDSK